MKRYLHQLLSDIQAATENIVPSIETGLSLHDWISAEAEEGNAPTRNLCDWSGITPEMLPPSAMLSDRTAKHPFALQVDPYKLAHDKLLLSCFPAYFFMGLRYIRLII